MTYNLQQFLQNIKPVHLPPILQSSQNIPVNDSHRRAYDLALLVERHGDGWPQKEAFDGSQ